MATKTANIKAGDTITSTLKSSTAVVNVVVTSNTVSVSTGGKNVNTVVESKGTIAIDDAHTVLSSINHAGVGNWVVGI